MLNNLPIQIVHEPKKEVRKPTNYLLEKIAKSDHLRGTMEEIQIKKARKK